MPISSQTAIGVGLFLLLFWTLALVSFAFHPRFIRNSSPPVSFLLAETRRRCPGFPKPSPVSAPLSTEPLRYESSRQLRQLCEPSPNVCVKSRLCVSFQTTNSRLVEAKISALGLGTGSGESQWCNRLPEVCDDLGGRFCVL